MWFRNSSFNWVAAVATETFTLSLRVQVHIAQPMKMFTCWKQNGSGLVITPSIDVDFAFVFSLGHEFCVNSTVLICIVCQNSIGLTNIIQML